MVWLSGSQDAVLRDLAAANGKSKEDTAAAIVRGHFTEQLTRLAQTSRPENEAPQLSVLSQVLLASDKRKAGAHQEEFFAQMQGLAAGPGDHRVLFAEAGTGVGKTFAMLVAAAEFALGNPHQVVVLAFPTYAVLEQAHQSWSGLRTDVLGGDRPADRVVLSQAAFVSETAIQEWMDAVGPSELRKRVEAWIDGGAAAAPGSRSDAPWQMLSLQEACEGLFPEAFEADVNVAMRLDDDDAGYVAYKVQKGSRGLGKQSAPERVLFMTHAMLGTMILGSRAEVRRMLGGSEADGRAGVVAAWQAQSSKERGVLREEVNDHLAEVFEAFVDDDEPLVYADLLIVDEGHLFEEWISKVVGSDISVWSLIRDVKALRSNYPRAVGANAVAALEQEFEVLKLVDKEGELEEDTRGGSLAGLWKALEQVGPVTGKAAKTREWRRINAVKRVAEVLRKQIVGTGSTIARLVWSPDRMWPRIQVGKASVSRELDWLWSRMAARSVIVSATLYEVSPSVNVETARRTLAVRSSSVEMMAPLHPSWIFDPVTVLRARLLCRPDQTYRFVRPKLSLPATEPELAQRARWAEEVAEYVVEAWKSSAGGMLVLMTSYTDVRLVWDLVATRVPDDTCIVQQPGKVLAEVRQRFVNCRRGGAKPIMILVGAGWTGFDVSLPGDENAVTDLVIPAMPFGVNRSMTQAARELTQGMLSVTYAATMMARQGLGRLVRFEHTLANRKIHFLDARWEMPEKRGIFLPIMRWIDSKYRRVLDV